MVDKYRNQWEENADVFTDLIARRGTPHHRNILNPCVQDLIGEVEGKTLLDAGCGEGYLSRYYAKRGATVTAIDFSRRLIESAIEFTEEDGLTIDYKVADICHMKSIEDEEFDAIISNLVLLNILCLQEAFNEFHRVLKTRGYLIFSIVHPAFNFYGPGSWEMGEKNPETGRREGLFFKVDHYFNEKEYERYWKTRKGEDFPAPISFFHRTLETYLNTLQKSGFELVDFREPRPAGTSLFFDRENRIPFFAVFKARKV